MATLASAKEKYTRKTGPGSAAVSKYNAAKGRMSANYGAGMRTFLGQGLAPHVQSAYDSGIAGAQYRGGDPDKWERNFRAAMTGG